MKFIITGYDERARVFVGHWQIKSSRKRFGHGTAKPYAERDGAFLLSDNHTTPGWWAERVKKFKAAKDAA